MANDITLYNDEVITIALSSLQIANKCPVCISAKDMFIYGKKIVEIINKNLAKDVDNEGSAEFLNYAYSGRYDDMSPRAYQSINTFSGFYYFPIDDQRIQSFRTGVIKFSTVEAMTAFEESKEFLLELYENDKARHNLC